MREAHRNVRNAIAYTTMASPTTQANRGPATPFTKRNHHGKASDHQEHDAQAGGDLVEQPASQDAVQDLRVHLNSGRR